MTRVVASASGAADMRVSVTDRNPGASVCVSGELDVSNVGVLSAGIALVLDAPEPPPLVAVDLCGLRFADVVGAQALWTELERLRQRGCQPVVYGTLPCVARVFEVLKLALPSEDGSLPPAADAS